MKKYFSLLLLLFLLSGSVSANLIPANSSNYTSFLNTLVPGDTLTLAPGTYTNNLTLNSRNGTAAQPIVIMGSSNLYTTIFNAQSCCNTVSITQCSYLVVKNLELNGLNFAVDAVKGEGSAGNFAHHITLEYLNIINYGNNQQTVGISTKCHAWNWVIRKNKIVGAGTGMYLGNSNGDKPFVNGIIENNLIMNTIGYNMEIKHQSDTVRDNFSGTNVSGKTIIRKNVFCKESNGATGGNERPNLLVGGFPLTGAGSSDNYEIYQNFFYQNPTEALFQGTGNIMLYENIFVNHIDPAGYRAIYITPQNGVQPQDIKVFHNTMWVTNSSGGMRIFNPNSSYQQYCYSNVVFAPLPITNFVNALDNVTDTYTNASLHTISPTTNLSTLNLYPLSGQLTGTTTPNTLFQSNTNWDKDFNGDLYNWTFRGAYSGCCTNNGWQLQLDTMPSFGSTTTFISSYEKENSEIKTYPNPFTDEIFVSSKNDFQNAKISISDCFGREVFSAEFSSSKNLGLEFLLPGIYFVRIHSPMKTRTIKIVKE